MIVEEAARRGLRVPEPAGARVLPGRGVEAQLAGVAVRAGNAAYLAEHGVRDTEPLLEEADRLGATAVLVAEGDRLAGAILLRDRVREGIKEAVARLQEMEIAHQVMLTGDRRRAAEVIAREIGIPNVEAELLPEQKLDRVRQLSSQGRKVAMVGDGINDAPGLAAADVGVAVAGASDITAEAADVVYLPHSLDRLPRSSKSAGAPCRRRGRTSSSSPASSTSPRSSCAPPGKIGPIGAAFTHQISSFFVMMNSLRLLRVAKARKRRTGKAGHRCGGRVGTCARDGRPHRSRGIVQPPARQLAAARQAGARRRRVAGGAQRLLHAAPG